MNPLAIVFILGRGIVYCGPVLVAALYLVLRREHIPRKVRFLVASGVSGYPVFYTMYLPLGYGLMQVFPPSGMLDLSPILLAGSISFCFLPVVCYCFERSLRWGFLFAGLVSGISYGLFQGLVF